MIWWTSSPCDPRAFDPMPRVNPRRLHLKKTCNIVPHGKNKRDGQVYKVRRNIRLESSDNRDAYMYYNPILRVNMNIHTCHLRTMQALAWVRVALPRGLARHVASTWLPRENNPPFIPFNCFKRFKLKNKFRKIRKDP